MCTRYTNLYKCGHCKADFVECASSRITRGKCPVFKLVEIQNDYKCDDCEEAEDATKSGKGAKAGGQKTAVRR